MDIDRDIKFHNTPVFNGPNYIHSIECGFNKEEKMIIIHGFGATGLTFYKMFKPLSEKYNIYCPDLLGMGLSSRPIVKMTDYNSTINFFVDSLEDWRDKLNIRNFHLVGHSLGGYIATKYALKYPSAIKKFSLMSPVGVTDPLKNPVINNMEIWRKIGARFSSPIWKLKLSYQKPYQLAGIIGYYIVKKVVRIKYPLLPHNENDALGHYFAKILSLPENTERCIYYLFKPPVPSAIFPLEHEIFESNFDINFYFGETDWMDREGCKNLSQLDSKRFKLHIIKHSGHNMKLENPGEITNFLLKH